MLGIHKHGPLLGGSRAERTLKRAATAKHGAQLEAADVPAPAVYDDPSDRQHAQVAGQAAASIAQRYPVQRQKHISRLGPEGAARKASAIPQSVLPGRGLAFRLHAQSIWVADRQAGIVQQLIAASWICVS